MSDERRYEVLAVLGQGGFGTVYHARFLGEGGFTKEVALKVLHPDKEGIAEIASRLRDEARVLGLIRHRAIVAVDRLTLLDGRWTVVMEYIEGQDVEHLLHAGPAPVGAALEITAEVAGALHAAYTRIGPGGQPLRLLHRDLKPSNIRITPYGGVKVLDFGIARAEFNEREAKTRSLAFGTPEYMSPERLDFSGDAASGDVYALGVVLYEILTGSQLGRSSANPARHARKHTEAESALRAASVPQAAADLVLQMLSYEEHARPTAAEVERRANALSRSVGGATLREWVDGLADTFAQAAPAASAITGSILTERPEHSAEAAETVWQRTTLPPPAPQSARAPTPLTPALTGATPAVNADKVPLGPTLTRSTGRLVQVALFLALCMLVVLGTGLWLLRGRLPAAASPVVASTTDEVALEPVATSPPPELPSNDVIATAEAPSAVVAEPTATATLNAAAPTSEVNGGLSAGPAVNSKSPPPLADIGLSGDATRVSLVSKGRTVTLPGKAPAGSYKIFASFEGEPEAPVGKVSVVAGQKVTILCGSQFGKCQVSEEAR